jgi:hypothetical protein
MMSPEVEGRVSARVANILLQEWPADDARPREIYGYWVEGEGDKHWKIDPANFSIVYNGNIGDIHPTSICSSSRTSRSYGWTISA